MKRWVKEDQDEWQGSDKSTIDWLIWSEKRVNDAISDCIEIVEELHTTCDKYYERQILMTAIRLLEKYENNGEVNVRGK